MNSDMSMPGWYEVYNNNVSHLVGIELRNNSDNTIRTAAVQHQWIRSIWTNLTQENNSLAKEASAWAGIANLTVPLLSTVCVSAINSNSTDNSTMNMWAGTPALDGSDSTVMPVYVSAVSGTNFTGANCTVTIGQGYFRECFQRYRSSNS